MKLKYITQPVKILAKILNWTLVGLSLVLAGFLGLIYFNLIPFNIFIITSGSMNPAVPAGSLVLTQQLGQYQIGDIISFTQPNRSNLVTHRVVGTNQSGTTFVTQGDANEDPDPAPIPQINVQGKVLYYLPHIGQLISWLQTKTGILLGILLPASLLIVWEVFQLIRKYQSNSKSPNQTLKSSITAKLNR